MTIRTLDDVIAAVRTGGKKRLVVAYAQDAHTLEAVNDAVEMELVEGILVGDVELIKKICEEIGIDYKKFTIVPEKNDVEAVNTAVRMVREGKGDVLMKGLVSTDKYMRGILSKEFGLVPPRNILTHLTVMELPKCHKLTLISDVAIIPVPDIKQKMQIIKYLVDAAQQLGVKTPKVACLSPSEQVLLGIESSVEATILSKMGDRGVFGDAKVDGPLALDVALFKEVVEIKKLKGSSVAGDADCLLFPNLDAGNIFFKAMTQFTETQLACTVVGASAPCVLTSRGDSKQTKLNSIALACLLSNKKQ